MTTTLPSLTDHLLSRLVEVRRGLGVKIAEVSTADTPIAEVLDSMGLVEFLGVVADDCGVDPGLIDRATGMTFTTVGDLAASLAKAGLPPSPGSAASGPENGGQPTPGPAAVAEDPLPVAGWLSTVSVSLPAALQSAADIDRLLDRPAGWFQGRTGIRQRRVWINEDPADHAADAGRQCLAEAELRPADVGVLLATSEAPPRLVGWAADLHHRLGLSPAVPALELGGACVGFLSAVRVAQALLPRVGSALIIAVEAPSRYLRLDPSNPSTALFGDGAAACLVCEKPVGPDPIPLTEVILGTDGAGAELVCASITPDGPVSVHLRGRDLTLQAVARMADAVTTALSRLRLRPADLDGVVAHGGNGRMPRLLARKLKLPEERVWSETTNTGNLGSVSLPATWALRRSIPRGPVAWAAVGAGLTWGTMVSGLWNSG